MFDDLVEESIYCIEYKLKRFVERPQWCVLTTTSIGPSLPGKVFALELLLGISLGEFNYIDINIHLHSYQSDIISQILNHDERIRWIPTHLTPLEPLLIDVPPSRSTLGISIELYP